jgi:SAM-dependent methyltransferase
MESTTPWTSGEPDRSPFAMPSGLPGRIAGRVMLWQNSQREVAGLLDVRPGARVLEIGYGPGGLVRLLRRTGAERICGVDPSPVMRAQASRPHRAQIAAGRIDLRLGTAQETGFGDAEFDRVVSVNNIAIWPDLGAGLREAHRVTRPGGRVVIAWHGGARPSLLTRRLTLPASTFDLIERELGGLFHDVVRHQLPELTAWTAIR